MLKSDPLMPLKTKLCKKIVLCRYPFLMYGVMDIFHTVKKIELQRKITYCLLFSLWNFKLPWLSMLLWYLHFFFWLIRSSQWNGIFILMSQESMLLSTFLRLCLENHCNSKENVPSENSPRSFKKDQNNKNISCSQFYNGANENIPGSVLGPFSFFVLD